MPRPYALAGMLFASAATGCREPAPAPLEATLAGERLRLADGRPRFDRENPPIIRVEGDDPGPIVTEFKHDRTLTLDAQLERRGAGVLVRVAPLPVAPSDGELCARQGHRARCWPIAWSLPVAERPAIAPLRGLTADAIAAYAAAATGEDRLWHAVERA
ncbi:MAG: hypothetical protein R3F65_30655, partial [bacterium]